MHVAIDAISFNDHIRGPDRYLIHLLKALAALDDGTRYTIFYAPWQLHYDALSLPMRFNFHRCQPFRQRSARVLWHAMAFPKIVKQVQPDVLHLPNLIYLPRLGIPTVLTIHDLSHYRYPDKFGAVRSRILRQLIPRTVRNADTVISVSEYTRADVHRYLDYPDERIRVILEGGPELAQTIGTAETGRPYFLYVGQLERSKNIHTLVRGFLESDLLRQHAVELRIAGRMDNAEEDIRAVLAEHSDSHRVKLLGYVPDNELPGLYTGCQAFVFPSLVEGFGLVLLEAMGYGAPVLAANTSVIPEVVGDAGLLVDVADAEVLRATMERLYTEPQLRSQLRQRGYERQKLFSWARAAEETACVYRETLVRVGASQIRVTDRSAITSP
jgi:alpha-1,3-rhamnosyl/mannosyltransferase